MVAQRLAHPHRVGRLRRGARRDPRRRFHFHPRILDRPDQPSRRLRRLAHRHRRLLRRRRNLRCLAQHPPRRSGGVAGLDAELLALARGALDGAADRIAEILGEPVARRLGAVLAIHVVDLDGDVALQRGEAHQRVDQPGESPVLGADPADQDLERHPVARADHREQRHRRHVRSIGGGDRTLDRFDPGPPLGVQKAVPEEDDAEIDHLLRIVGRPAALVGEAAQPLLPIGFRDRADLRLQRLPGGAARGGQRPFEIEDAKTGAHVDAGGRGARCRQILKRNGVGHETCPLCGRGTIGHLPRDMRAKWLRRG